MKTRCAILVLAWAVLCFGASAQPTSAAATACPAATELTARHLYGLWQTNFSDPVTGLAVGRATLLLERHPDWAESVRGRVQRGDVRALISGDVDEGRFTLDESEDGVRISASWNGTVVPDRCGREIRGSWSDVLRTEVRAFVLRKLAD